MNAADGALVHRDFGDELPAWRPMVGGETVSVLDGGTSQHSSITAYRVTPEVTRIEAGGGRPRRW